MDYRRQGAITRLLKIARARWVPYPDRRSGGRARTMVVYVYPLLALTLLAVAGVGLVGLVECESRASGLHRLHPREVPMRIESRRSLPPSTQGHEQPSRPGGEVHEMYSRWCTPLLLAGLLFMAWSGAAAEPAAGPVARDQVSGPKRETVWRGARRLDSGTCGPKLAIRVGGAGGGPGPSLPQCWTPPQDSDAPRRGCRPGRRAGHRDAHGRCDTAPAPDQPGPRVVLRGGICH